MLCRSLLLLCIWIESIVSYSTNSASWSCLETNGSTLLSCLPGYLIDVENVVFESSQDETCSGPTRCHVKVKHSAVMTCNHKRTCPIGMNDLLHSINGSCGTARRFYTEYRCLPTLQEQKDFLCETFNARRTSLSDINLSCARNYHLYILNALIGLSFRQNDASSKSSAKCGKETPSSCLADVTSTYRSVCQRSNSKDQCKIRYQDRPNLSGCEESGGLSNYSLVEYLCVPGPAILDDLPQVDLCSTAKSTVQRGILAASSTTDEQRLCQKQLRIPRQSRLRMVALDRSSSDALTLRLSNPGRILTLDDYLDLNLTLEQTMEIEAKNLPISIYFQIDTTVPETTTSKTDRFGALQRGKAFVRQNMILFTIVLISLIVLLLLLLAVVICIFIAKKRRRQRQGERTRGFMKKLDNPPDHLQSPTDPRHLSSASPIVLPSLPPSHARPHSASSTTSSMIIHQSHDGNSDRESLLHSKPAAPHPPPPLGSADIDNFYEEIKEQQQQTALALSRHGNVNEPFNPYLEAKYFPDERRPHVAPTQPIRDHHENDKHYQQPRSDD